jgi:hypothetical protein
MAVLQFFGRLGTAVGIFIWREHDMAICSRTQMLSILYGRSLSQRYQLTGKLFLDSQRMKIDKSCGAFFVVRGAILDPF